MNTPIERLIDASGMRCTICNALAGACDCWTSCSCGWYALKGFRCRNPGTSRCSTKLRHPRPYTDRDVTAAYRAAQPPG